MSLTNSTWYIYNVYLKLIFYPPTMYVTMIEQKDINIKKKFKYFLHKNLERIVFVCYNYTIVK